MTATASAVPNRPAWPDTPFKTNAFSSWTSPCKSRPTPRDHTRWGQHPTKPYLSLEVRPFSITKNNGRAPSREYIRAWQYSAKDCFACFSITKPKQHEAQIAVNGFGPWLVFERFLTYFFENTITSVSPLEMDSGKFSIARA